MSQFGYQIVASTTLVLLFGCTAAEAALVRLSILDATGSSPSQSVVRIFPLAERPASSWSPLVGLADSVVSEPQEPGQHAVTLPAGNWSVFVQAAHHEYLWFPLLIDEEDSLVSIALNLRRPPFVQDVRGVEVCYDIWLKTCEKMNPRKDGSFELKPSADVAGDWYVFRVETMSGVRIATDPSASSVTFREWEFYSETKRHDGKLQPIRFAPPKWKSGKEVVKLRSANVGYSQGVIDIALRLRRMRAAQATRTGPGAASAKLLLATEVEEWMMAKARDPKASASELQLSAIVALQLKSSRGEPASEELVLLNGKWVRNGC
jgi:hypothetical protein